MSVAVLLDTCALLDADNGLLPPSALSRVEAAHLTRQAHMPATVALEVAQKVWAAKLTFRDSRASWRSTG